MGPSLSILSDPPDPPTAVGLIAGAGRLPVLIADGLRKRGHPVHGLGLGGQYEPELPAMCESFREVGILRIGSWGRTLRKMDIHHAVMVGRVDKAKLMHDPWRLVRTVPDMRTIIGWYRHLRHDKRSYAVLAAVADELDRNGVSLIDSTAPIPDDLADAGVMTSKKPSRELDADIRFVWPLLAQVLRLDIGQAVAVRERDIVAVEAVEGTDRMVQRAGRICRGRPWTLCKGARAGHDRRSDVPTVGPRTIEMLAANGGRCLALAAGDVIMIDKAMMIDMADKLGVSIVGVPVSYGTSMPDSVVPAGTSQGSSHVAPGAARQYAAAGSSNGHTQASYSTAVSTSTPTTAR